VVLSKRGWSRIADSRPAREVDIRYGSGLLLEESGGWPRYLAIATRTPWRIVQPYLASRPAGAGIVRFQDWEHLEEVAGGLPDDAELVVGIGGGTSLDASKYVALRKDLPLVLVPTIASTGSIIHGAFAKWKGHYAVPPASEWPYCDAEHVVVDYDLMLEAPEHLHTAGLGDILCGFSGVAEWRHEAGRGRAPAVDAGAVEPLLEWYEQLAGGFAASLSADGSMTADSVRFIVSAIQQRDDRALVNPHAPGADHVLHLTIEHVCDRGLIHGEMTALGSVIVAWVTGQHEEHMERLDRCRVRYRPSEIGLTRDEFRRCLEALPEDLATRGVDSILGRAPVVGARFDELWEFLEGG